MRKLTLQPEQILVPGEYELGNEAILKIYFRIFEKGHGEDLPPVLVCSSTYVPASERQEFYVEKIKKYVDWLKGGCSDGIKDDNTFNYDNTDSIDTILGKLKQVNSAKPNELGSFFIMRKFDDIQKGIAKITQYLQITKLFELGISQAGYFLLDGNHRSAAAELTHQPLSVLELEKDDDITELQQMTERGELFNFKLPVVSIRNLYFSFVEWIVGEQVHGGHFDEFKTVRERIEELTSNGHLPEYMIERYRKS